MVEVSLGLGLNKDACVTGIVVESAAWVCETDVAGVVSKSDLAGRSAPSLA